MIIFDCKKVCHLTKLTPTKRSENASYNISIRLCITILFVALAILTHLEISVKICVAFPYMAIKAKIINET